MLVVICLLMEKIVCECICGLLIGLFVGVLFLFKDMG